MDILACPIDKYYPLELHVFEEERPPLVKYEKKEGKVRCPACKEEFGSKEEMIEHFNEEHVKIVEGVIICPKCLRWYPIRDEIPEMLPDELRTEKDELLFLQKWKKKIPPKILSEGKPFNLKRRLEKG